MSGEEAVVGFVSGPLAVLFWGRWLYLAAHTSRLVRPAGRGAALVFAFLASFGTVLAALLVGADPVVRESPGYILLFLAVAGVALAAATAAGTLIGVSALEDALRRPNPAAAWVVAGLWAGTGLCAAGANLGRGDTIGTTLGPLALAVAFLLLLWALFTSVVGTGAVTQDRDTAAGVRLAGLLVAWGLILGRAVAGDWVSAAETWVYFAGLGWPALALLAAAVWIEHRVPRPGWRPAVAYPVVAAGWAAILGPP